MSDDWLMSAFAAQDAYRPADNPWMPDVGAPAVSPGPQISKGVPWANRAADVMSGLFAPQPRDANSPIEYRTASPLVRVVVIPQLV